MPNKLHLSQDKAIPSHTAGKGNRVPTGGATSAGDRLLEVHLGKSAKIGLVDVGWTGRNDQGMRFFFPWRTKLAPQFTITRGRLGLVAVLASLTAAGLVAYKLYSRPVEYLRLARVALESQDYDTARVSLSRYLEARPDDASAHLLAAQLDRRANRYTDSVKHLDACRRLGGPADGIELERALGAIQNGVYNTELDALVGKYLARPDADQYLILEALSQGLTKTYRLKEALVCLDRMLLLQPDSAYALRRRAWIYSQIERHDRAEADYRRALQSDPEDAVARLGLAQILLNFTKNGREAAEHFERLWTTRKDATVALGLARS